jgi:hypothetical protein
VRLGTARNRSSPRPGAGMPAGGADDVGGRGGLARWEGAAAPFKATHALARDRRLTAAYLGAGADLGRTHGRAARTRPAVRWTPSGQPARGARRGGLQGPLGRLTPREARGTDA